MIRLEIFLTALRLGLTSFGGPIAHLSYFHDEYVKKKKWISEHSYADLVALCQFLPGPASSQVGMAIGFSRGGIFGALLAWLGFTLPSAIFLILCGLGLTTINLQTHQSWLHGLKVVAVAVVAQAVLSMAKNLCPDRARATLAIISASLVLLFNTPWIQILVLFLAGLYGAIFFTPLSSLPHEPIHRGNKNTGFFFLIIFFLLLLLLPLLSSTSESLKIFDSFYRSGALVFGGGHVVLPLLKNEVVSTGLVNNDLFLVGYGLSNAVPGPLFTFSAFLGSIVSGWKGALIALFSIFLPSFLLIIGILPFWEKLRTKAKVRKAMLGLNAAVVGILLASFYNPVWTSAIISNKDFILASFGFLLLEMWKLPSWLVVFTTLLASLVIY